MKINYSVSNMVALTSLLTGGWAQGWPDGPSLDGRTNGLPGPHMQRETEGQKGTRRRGVTLRFKTELQPPTEGARSQHSPPSICDRPAQQVRQRLVGGEVPTWASGGTQRLLWLPLTPFSPLSPLPSAKAGTPGP